MTRQYTGASNPTIHRASTDLVVPACLIQRWPAILECFFQFSSNGSAHINYSFRSLLSIIFSVVCR